ncbi:hypothetical protein UFOVP1033_94 [uncultured Caudovirales phage]|uniref:Uncharacterized protein n=1 Tax=uncultured Caudovirales phage TaxID=2100421 RepID=A0A6J5T027_9CAUD|nr:hypothetical protein UFOVP1033_94 [uncultured Caudovirales phage]CAB4220880.1 hypothetical protein UFOVP1631_94 [uncultured Caudovirales phage]
MTKWWNVHFETMDQGYASDLLTVQVEADTPDEGIKLGQERFHSLVLTHNNWQFNDISETSN